MLTGITNIEIIPPYAGSIGIEKRLIKLFDQAISIRAAIAFWTLSEKELALIAPFKALKVLQNKNSFLCVDIQPPTNLDYLAELVERGVSVYLNIRRLPKEFERYTTSPGLLHTKILLADMSDDEAEFWIGSHNWTKFALRGPNTEASVIFTLHNKAPIFFNGEFLLSQIRDRFCRKFEIEKLELYKMLQKFFLKSEQGKNIIELEGENVDNLIGQVILVFGMDDKDFDIVAKVGTTIFLSIHDSKKIDNKYLYEAEVLHSGRMRAYNPAADGINFRDPRRYAFTVKRKYQYLDKERKIDYAILDSAYYYAGLQIHKIISHDYMLFSIPSQKISLWKEASSETLLDEANDIGAQRIKELQSLILEPCVDDLADLAGVKSESEVATKSANANKPSPLISKKIRFFSHLVGKSLDDFK